MESQMRSLILKKALLGTSIITCLTSSGLSEAQSNYFVEYNKTIARLGAQATGFYFGVNEPLGQNCIFGNIYIAPDRKGIYSQLLVAKLTNRRISRLDYRQPGGPGTECDAEIVEITD